MALAEGTIRKNGTPAKKPGYGLGRTDIKTGRPRRKTCLYSECDLPPRTDRDGKCGPSLQTCSEAHRLLAYRERHVGDRYGMSLDELTLLGELQGNICAICKGEDPASNGAFHVDHDHATGQVRGLLCGRCNRMLGQALDNPVILLAAVEYLRDPPASRL